MSIDDRDASPVSARSYVVESDTGAWEVGWDPYLGTFYARDPDGSPDAANRTAGFDVHGVATVDELAQALGTPVPDAVAVALTQDARRWPHKPIGVGPINPGIEYTLAGPGGVRRVPGPHVPGAPRQPHDRYRIQLADGTWWEVGWEPGAGRY